MSKSKSVSQLTGLPTHRLCHSVLCNKKINYIRWEEMHIPLCSQLKFSSPSPRISPTAHSTAAIPFALISMFLNLGSKVAPTQALAIETQLRIHQLHSWNKCFCNYRGETQWELRLSEICVHIIFFSAGCTNWKTTKRALCIYAGPITRP